MTCQEDCWRFSSRPPRSAQTRPHSRLCRFVCRMATIGVRSGPTQAAEERFLSIIRTESLWAPAARVGSRCRAGGVVETNHYGQFEVLH